MSSKRNTEILWPASCYPRAITNEYPFLQYAPGPRALRGVLARHMRAGISVLDIGCGMGIGACHIAASGGRGVRYIGIDPDVAACRQGREILAGLPPDSVRGQILERSLQEYLDTSPPPVDLILWAFAFHDCTNVADEPTHAPLCAAVAALLVPGGTLVVMDACFAPGVSDNEIERAYAYMERLLGHSDRGRYFPPGTIATLFTGTGLTLIEHQDVPLVALARYLDLPHARAAVFVFVKRPNDGDVTPSGW